MKTWITVEIDKADFEKSDEKIDAMAHIIITDFEHWLNQMRIGRIINYKVTNQPRFPRRQTA